MIQNELPGERRAEFLPDRDRPRAWTLRMGGADQSYVDLDDPTRLEFDYIQRMADVIDLLGEAGEPLRCVHIGGAGMTLPRYVAHTRPRSAQIVLEPDIDTTALVRERLPLPKRSGIKVRGVDGRSGIAALADRYADVIVLDAYDGTQIPADLGTTEFFADIGRVLSTDGVALLNLADRTPFPYVRNVLRGLETSLPGVILAAEPATLKGRRFGNVLAIASRQPIEAVKLRIRAARSMFRYTVMDHAEVAAKFAGGNAYTDAKSEPSPHPMFNF